MKRNKCADFKFLQPGGSGGGLYFLRNSIASGGSQIGAITHPPKLIDTLTSESEGLSSLATAELSIVKILGDIVIAIGRDLVYSFRLLHDGKLKFLDIYDLNGYIERPRYLSWGSDAFYVVGFNSHGWVNKIDFSDPGNLKHIYGEVSTKRPQTDAGRSICLYSARYLAVTYSNGDITFHDEATGIDITEPLYDADFAQLINIVQYKNFLVAVQWTTTPKIVFIDITNPLNPSLYKKADLNIQTPINFEINGDIMTILSYTDNQFSIWSLKDIENFSETNNKLGSLIDPILNSSTSMTTFGDYSLVGGYIDKTLIPIKHTDLSNPTILTGFSLGAGNAFLRVATSGNHAIVVKEVNPSEIYSIDLNGYYLPMLAVGNVEISEKARVKGDLEVSGNIKLKGNIYGYSGNFVNEVGAQNLPQSTINIKKIEDLPPVKYIEKTGSQAVGVDTITINTSGLEQFMQIEGDGIPEYTYITAIGGGFITISQNTTQGISPNTYKIDGHIDLEDAKDLELKFDSNDSFLIKYYLKVPSTGSIALNTLGATRYVFAGPIGGAVRGTMAADTYIAFLSKFLVGQLWPFAQWFDIDGSQEATIFTENVVSFATPTSYFAVGRIDGVNISNQVSQFKGWSTGLATNNPDKLKPSKWSFRGGNPNLTSNVACFYVSGTLGNLADFVGCDFTPTDADPNNPHQYFFYIDPATAATAAAGTNPTELVLRGCNIKGPKNQYWFPGSATGKDVGVDVSKCQPLADSSSFYFTEIKTGLVTTDFAQDTARRLNFGTQEEISDSPIERFILNPSYNEIEYVGIQDKLHNLIIKAKLKSNSTAAISFSLCIGNRHITPVSFVLKEGTTTTWIVTTSAPHGLVPNDYVLFEGAFPVAWNNKFIISNVSLLSFEVDLTVSGAPSTPSAVLLSRELPHSKVLHGLTTNIETKIIEGKATLAQDSFVLVSGLNTDPVKTITCYPGTTLSAERIG